MTPDQSCLVYTPEALADALVAALRPKRKADESRWLEPCVGQGALLSALARSGIPSQQITGVDLAGTPEPTDTLACVRRGVDFLAWSKRTALRFDRVVANPPYLGIRELAGSLLKNALTTTVPIDGTLVPHRANCWYAFLCASISLLREGGHLAFILPAAWEYADYAAPMREGIASLFRTVKTYRSVHPLFSGVQEGSVVLVAEGYGAKEHGPIQRAEYKRADFMLRAIKTGASRRAEPVISAPSFVTKKETKPLSQIVTIRIGAVTGDGSYFLMNEERRKELGLPTDAFVPILSRACHLEAAEVTHDHWKRLRDAGDRVWLFRPPERLLKDRAVRSYLKLPKEDGGCDRTALQVRRREPTWFRVKLPQRPDGFVTGMGRFGPWIALNRDPDLTATNTLYAIRFNERLTVAEQSAWALMLFTEKVQQQMERVLRRYPDGLVKVEPGDFGRLVLPVPKKSVGALGVYREVIECVVASDTAKAIKLANRFA
ncbi:MAG TPA: hypothetical protein VNO30_44200 [Kofleriaceae bacterium]|nr:hypothetical protein [Kofleriaceae bacterium]